MKNILTVILSELKIKYTHKYANELYNRTPDRNSFYGLTYMLALYGVKARGYYVECKCISSIKPLFVAQTDGEFVLVYDIQGENVLYYNAIGIRHKIAIEKFLELWTGNVLTIANKVSTGEPDYLIHKRNEWKERVKQSFLYLSLSILLSSILISKFSLWAGYMLVYAIFASLGLIVSIQLLKQQMYNKNGNKFCGLFTKGDCGTVTHSSAAKALFNITWSEIGCGYFLSTLLLLIIFPDYYSQLGIINTVVLPYSAWSLWYQKVVLKKWCPLCIIIQIIIWAMFAILCFSGIVFLKIYTSHLLIVAFYCIVILLVHYYVVEKDEMNRKEVEATSYRSILCRTEIFANMLDNQPYMNVSECDSNICVGSHSAQTYIAVIINPFCEPCANAHMILQRIFGNRTDIHVRYIFVSNNKMRNAAALYLIDSYFRRGEAAIEEWFKMSNNDRRQLIELIEFVQIDEKTENELRCHKAFFERNIVKRTPTILVNGHMVPVAYSIEDLAYTLFE